MPAIDAFATAQPCGYFRIVADAGLGNTAVAAELTRRKGAVSFFASSSRGLRRPDQCLNHLSSELIVRFGLPQQYLPARSGEDSTLLSHLLTEAVTHTGAPVWVVIDALDEADAPSPGSNPLLLPDHLPPGVYVFLTSRPGADDICADPQTPAARYTIGWNEPGQVAALEEYLQRQVRENPAVARALARPGARMTEDRFVARLGSASQGNFMYLRYVIAAIEQGDTTGEVVDLDALPPGLEGYYSQFWSSIRAAEQSEGWAAWDGLFRPVLECRRGGGARLRRLARGPRAAQPP